MTTIKAKTIPLKYVDGVDEIVQRATVRVETFLGEWPFDDEAGIDWLEYSTTKDTPDETIAARIKSELVDIDGVNKVTVTVPSPQTYEVELTVAERIDDGGTVGVVVDATRTQPTTRVKL